MISWTARLDVRSGLHVGTVHTLVGLKHLDDAKQRLTPPLSPLDRRMLMIRMLRVVVSQARAAALGPVALATSEPSAPALARDLGIGVVSDGGLPWNEGLVHALNRLQPPPAAVLYLAADLPLLTADELRRFAAEAPVRGVAVARSRDGGSNALLVRPADAITPMFGHQRSSIAHQQQAQERGLDCHVIDIHGLALDVDTIDDAWDAGLIPRPIRGSPQPAE